jgi:BirA family biotin operon repressor/biotin-[acetyl-CoA-carboxylase] ligase
LSELKTGRKLPLKLLNIDARELEQQLGSLDGLDFHIDHAEASVCIPGGLDLLDAQAIRSDLPEQASGAIKDIEVFMDIDSTNSYLLGQNLTDHRGLLVFAEQQTAGRGRRGRTWVSPFGTNLYMSLLWRIPLARTSVEGLSLAVGLAVILGLESQGFNGIKMKWPNDLLLDGSKIAGILVEMKPPKKDYVDVVIGIGVNLFMPATSGQLIDQSWRDLSNEMSGESRNSIASGIATSLVKMLDQFAMTGFPGFREAWQQRDAYYDSPVELHMGDNVVSGIAKGVSEQGAVCIQVDHEIREYHGGEITMRATHDS